MQNSIYEQDFLLKELPQAISDLLRASNLPWLTSLEFCTQYDDNQPERVLIKMDAEKIHRAVFYRFTKRMGLLRVIEIIGFPDIVNQDILGLLKTHHAQLALVNRLENPVKPDEKWHSTHANVYCHSYVSIAELPPSKEEYLKQLGKNKREQLPKYWRRLNRHFNNEFEIRCESTTEIKLEEVIQLDCLNRERRSGRGKVIDSVLDIQQRQKNRWPLTQASGFLVTFRYQGKIVSGLLCYLCGNEASFIVIAHDPAYENLRVGTLVVWKMIECLIDKGITRVNFLWGRQEYKIRFLGVEYPWSIHIISPYQWLTIVWKYQIIFFEFYTRAWRFGKTRMGNITAQLNLFTNYCKIKIEKIYVRNSWIYRF